MITRKIIIFYCFCYFIVTNSASSQSKTKRVTLQAITVTILGPKNGKNKTLQDFQGFYSGLNLSYFKKMSEAERAILGYIATLAGTDCELENYSTDTNEARYSCKLPIALGIGYQCSNQYLAFERKWFRNDSVVLKELKECNIRPAGANYVTSFGKIVLTKFPGRIKIFFEKNSFSMRSMTSDDWTETYYFTVDIDQVHLVKRTHTNARIEKPDITDSL